MGQIGDQAFEVLRRRSQLKLFGDVPQSPQPDAAQAYLFLEFPKERLDPIARPVRAGIGGRRVEGADLLAGGLVPIHREAAR